MKKKLLAILILIDFGINAQTFEWAKANRGEGLIGKVVKTDNAGNVYSAGVYGSISDLDPSAATYTLPYNGASNNYSDIYFQKLDNNGNFVWAAGFGGSGQESVTGFAQDNMSNTYLIGDFENSVDFDISAGTNSITSNGLYDIYIQKIDANGNYLWTKRIGGTSTDRGQGIAYKNGFIYIYGLFSGTVDVDPNAGILNFNSNSGSFDLLIEKLDLNGNLIWAKQIGGNNSELARAMTIDNFDNIILTGGFSDVVDFDPNAGTANFTSLGSHDIFILKLDSAGNYIWAKSIGDANSQYGNSIATDQASNIFLAGAFTGTLDFDPNAGVAILNSTSSNDSYICKYTPAGNLTWANQFGNSIDNETCNSVFVDQLGFVYLTGNFQNTVDFDPSSGVNQLTSMGYGEIYFSKFDNDGTFTWAQSLPGTGDDQGICVYVDSIGKLYATGDFVGTTDFDPSPASYTYSPSGCCNESFVLKWGQNICSYFTLSIDTLTDISCSNLTGYAACHASFGTSPYNYNWQTTPTSTTQAINFNTGGLLQLTATDAGGCIQTRTLITTSIANPSDMDLRVNVVTNNFRIGFPTNIVLNSYNDGCVPASGILKYVLDNKLIYNYAFPLPTAINGDTLAWDFSNIRYDSTHIMPLISVTTKTTATIGDSINVYAFISLNMGDIDPTNNLKDYKVPVINGYDPNDKKVFPEGKCVPGYILNNQLLTYTVRFQNTGNSNAINITVLDSIDTDLNINTLRIVGKSHEMYAEKVAGNTVKFHFNNINLPDSGANEVASHGYVIFEIMPNASLANDTPIENRADIYFDFNEPVLTNMVKNTVVTSIPVNCALVTFITENTSSNITLFPNPTNGNITIHLSGVEENTELEITNLVGQMVYKNNFKNTGQINLLLDSAPGIYFAKILSKGKKQTVVKIVKE